ncbi:hypothetical protein R6Q59_034500 [Mikania micrantha]
MSLLLAEQRSNDENETINRSVKELDNNGGDIITGSKVGDEEVLKAPLNVQKFRKWNGSSSDVLPKSYATIFSKVREEGLKAPLNVPKFKKCTPSSIRCNSHVPFALNHPALRGDQDTNELKYFSVSPFNVHGDDDLNGINSYGGGGRARQRDPGILAVPKFEQHRGDVSAGDGDRSRQIQVGDGKGTKRSGWWEKWFRCWHG